MPRRRLRVVKNNRTQILLFSILTLILTAAVVWGGRAWLRNSETLVFAVGDAAGPEARFAARLATVLKNNSSRLRLTIVPSGDNAKALSQFDRKDANLAILRTDARIPPRARSIAILERDLFLLISPGGKKIKTIADLKKKKIAVIAESESSVALVRNILELSDTPEAAARIQMAPPGSTFDKLFASGFGAVIKVAHVPGNRWPGPADCAASVVARAAPEKASELATAILDIGERMENAKTLDALDELQDELETVLRNAVIGLRDGTISSDGLDTFRLGYEFVRDEIALRREHIKRHAAPDVAARDAAARDDNVVVVKAAQSA